jgi:SAM-dependent methyltransferase
MQATATAAECRGCGRPDLVPVLSLGPAPLANALRTADQLDAPEPRYPLEVALCPHCALVQLTETVDPVLLFRRYPYFSSVSDGMVRHARALAATLATAHALGPASLVVEIGSNDGYLLRELMALGVPVLGVEPARNVRDAAVARGVPTIGEFFDGAVARELATAGRRADVVVANNVMAHAPDINAMVAAVGTVLKPDGVLVMETPYLRDLVERTEFDTIYHEHVFYYSLTALDALLGRHGLTILDVERIPVHGGSLRVTAARRGRAAARVGALLRDEAAWGAADPRTYRCLGDRMRALCAALRALLGELKGRGARLAAYGAAAKGAILLHVAGIGPELLDFVVDRNPHKQGRFMPGTPLPIRAPAALATAAPDAVLLLAWNLADEVLAQERAYRERGGRFVLPVPEPRLV